MGAGGLGSRAIIGEYYARLEQDTADPFIQAITNKFNSDQESELYKWLGQVPQMREWIGGRQAKGLSEFEYRIVNKLFESTLKISVDDLRRDKTGQIMARINEQVERSNSHWMKLVIELLLDGYDTVCYDGQFFFDTDHTEGESGTQSNDITYNVTTPTAPTAPEAESAIMAALTALMAFKDNEGEPMNENAASFLVLSGTSLMVPIAGALKNTILLNGSTLVPNTLLNLGGFTFQQKVTPRMNALTDAFMLFRTDGSIKPIIRQEEFAPKPAAVAEGSELEFNERQHHYGVEASRGAGYGLWQRAISVTLT